MAEQWIIFGHLDGNVKLYGRKLIIYGSNKKYWTIYVWHMDETMIDRMENTWKINC